MRQEGPDRIRGTTSDNPVTYVSTVNYGARVTRFRRTAERRVAIAATTLLTAGLLSAVPAAVPGAAPAAEAAATPQVHHHAWDRPGRLRNGRHVGTTVAKRRLMMSADPQAKRKHWHVSRWVSPWVKGGFDFGELIPSWNGRTPGKSRIRIQVQARGASGKSSWDTIAVWANQDRHFKRRTRAAQPDDLGRVNVDTWAAGSGVRVDRWRIRVVFLKKPRARKSPMLSRVGATVSRFPGGSRATSRTTMRGTRELDVPRFSQMIHRGHYPQWGGGGAAWCSPTSTSMVLGYYGRLPKPRWTPDGHPNPAVDHAARLSYDYSYDGAGNWPFNTAYAGTRVGVRGQAFVTRLTDLRQAERFIRNGIPLVISLSFRAGELRGAPIRSTPGHLMVIRGFEADGDVIVNDPAAPNNGSVRRVYDRAQFERAWMTKDGLTYVITDPHHDLPRGGPGNW